MTNDDPIKVNLEAVQFGRKNKYSAYPGKRYIEIKDKVVLDWNDPSPAEASTDGIHISGNGFGYVKNLIISREGMDPYLADELASVVEGGDVIFHNCYFSGSGKGYLQGSGDSNYADLLKGQRVVFSECIFENCSRRNPFVQIGQGYLINCWIKNWGRNFHEKSFGIRAGKYGQVMAVNCIFEQEGFLTCLKRGNLLKDTFKQYLLPLFGVPGFMRGAYSDIGGHVRTINCYKNRWWVHLEHREGKMDKLEMLTLKQKLIANDLIRKLEAIRFPTID